MTYPSQDDIRTYDLAGGKRTAHPINPVNFRRSLRYHLRYTLGRELSDVSEAEIYQAVALSIRELMIDRMLETEERYTQADVKRVNYLSMEFLIGRSMENNLINLGLLDMVRDTLSKMNIEYECLKEYERDAALGNGGLGRLAACFLDSLATLKMPGTGYGINYDFGLFRQKIVNGYQKEIPDQWENRNSPWLIERADRSCLIPVYGHIEHIADRNGDYNPMWLGWQLVIGVPYDMPVVGYGGDTVNVLRLFSARPSGQFDMDIFNSGDYIRAVERKILSETISKVLYPSDSIDSGKELRLIQEYFLVACALRDIMRNFQRGNPDNLDAFADKHAIQLNDTHPALAVAELMRMLLDEYSLPWEKAWDITTRATAYTNHTLLPEALEKWPVPLMEKVLPRHLQIIYEINHRFLQSIPLTSPDGVDLRSRLSIIEEGQTKQVRMAYLSIIGSHSVNGVAALHSELITSRLVPDFYRIWPEKFNNKTNGITQRRWLLKANPALADLISDTIGDGWITNLDHLHQLEPYAEKADFQEAFMAIKRDNKTRLAAVVQSLLGEAVNPDSIFDIQIKRIHEYKRQLLNMMHVIHQYFAITEDGRDLAVPRTYVFAGKAAPGYWAAKQIIKLINNVGRFINNDPRARDQLRVVFLPDYRVSLAEKIFPAADVSEQISTAGKEASGTGNMKFALNGALTVGTLDGANIEIREEVGDDNIFIFGLTADEIARMRHEGSYNPAAHYAGDPRVKRVMDAFNSDMFCHGEPGLFRWIFDAIMHQGDEYFHLADLPSYIDAHEAVEASYSRKEEWATKAILNVARIGKFSSDRTIRQYAEEIWGIKPMK